MAGAPARTVVDYTVGDTRGMTVNADGSINIKSLLPVPVVANLVDGFNSQTATQAATTLISVPAGRSWTGVIGASCSTDSAATTTAEGKADVVFSTAGAAPVPAAGNVFAVRARTGAGAAGGTLGVSGNAFGSTPFTLINNGLGAVTLQTTITIAGSNGVVDAFAVGTLI